jgi:hypothetical protein
MDRITRGSAIASTILHVLLVLAAFSPRGCVRSHEEDPTATSTPPPGPPPTPTTVPPARPAQPTRRLVLAPAAARPLPALPPLSGPGARPAPPLPPELLRPIAPVATDRLGQGTSRGQDGDRSAPVALPQALPGRDDAVAQLRARRTSNAQLSREEKTLADGQEHLEFLLNRAVAQRWRHLLPEVREPRLVIQVVVDPSGRLVEGRLLSGSGSEAFDQVVGDWLRNETLTFPPIRAGVRYPFLVIIHR